MRIKGHRWSPSLKHVHSVNKSHYSKKRFNPWRSWRSSYLFEWKCIGEFWTDNKTLKIDLEENFLVLKDPKPFVRKGG